jgi:hypothetical protein
MLLMRQSVEISGNHLAISGNHRLPNSTMLLSPLAKPRGPTIREGTTLGDLPWAGKPVRTLPPRHISEVGALRHDKMRRAIRAHHGSSEVIRGHQRSSEVIRGHQRSSEVIRGHQRSSEVIRGHQRLSHLSKASTLPARASQSAPINAAIRAINRVAINRNQSASVAISRTQLHLINEALV